MPHNAIQRTVALDRQTDLSTPISDWDSLSANGGLLAFTSLDRSNIRQAVIDNENLKQRSGKTHAKINALKNNAFSAGTYLYSTDTNAAEGMQATRDELDELMLNSLGGEQQGYSAGIAGGTASAVDVETGDGTNLNPWDWGFFYDTSASEGYFRQIESIATDTLTMAPGHDLPFTPDAGGADIMYAVEAFWPDWDALEDHSHANHTVLSFYLKGRGPQDNFECIGCKVTLGFEAIAAGQLVKMTVNVTAADFNHESLTQPSLSGAVTGRPGDVVGRGARTRFEIEDFATALAQQNVVGEIQPTLGIEHEYVVGPAGYEGVNGFGITEASHNASMLQFQTLDYGGSGDDIDDWNVEFRTNSARKHALIQVGTSPTDSVGIYFPYLSYAEEPQAVSVGGREGRTIMMTALERPNDSEDATNGVDTSVLTTAQIHKALAKFYILRTK